MPLSLSYSAYRILYPFIGGIGGILTLVGTSIVICCQGGKPNGHMACAVLCVLGGICHTTGAGWLWYVYAQTQQVADAIGDSFSDSSEIAAAAIADAVVSWANILIIPTAVIQTIAFIFDMVSVILCCQVAYLCSLQLPTCALRATL